jgi:subtilisin-like proprotein convertase family protein
MALLTSSCGGQRGDIEMVNQELADKEPPKFIVEPKIDALGPNKLDLVFALNESSEYALVIRQNAQFGLSNSEIEDAEDRIESKAKAFETMRVSISDLLPGQKYSIFMTVKDSTGNVIAEPKISEFTTAFDTKNGVFSGTPPLAREGQYWRFKPEATLTDCNITLKDHPSWMKVEADGISLGGTPVFAQSGDQVKFTVVYNGAFCAGETIFDLKTVGDPFFDYAWYMNPKANKGVSWFNAPNKVDIDLSLAANAGLTGKGVKVMLVDSGMQVTHPDLKSNIDLNGNFNLDPFLAVGCQVCEPKDTTPPLTQGTYGDQGTAVAGIIAATGWNGIGSRGIAPSAKISAYNISAKRFTNVSDNDYLRIFSFAQDIICHSAVAPASVLDMQQTFDYYSYDSSQKAKAQLGRNGKGIVYIKAAGELGSIDGNAAMDQRATTAWGVIVSSYNSIGKKSEASSQGANVWISAPGGEAGYQSDYGAFDKNVPATRFYQGIIAPNIFNTELNCSVGYAKLPRYFVPVTDPDIGMFNKGRSSGFNLGWNPLNKNCNYTATTPNTPAAAGIVTGAVALLLEENPQLTWRQIKYILAKSAQPIESDRASELTNIGASVYERNPPWLTNAAGFRFHNAYGFGALNVSKALEIVKLKSYPNYPELFDTDWILAESFRQRIPTMSISGIFSDFASAQNLSIEAIQIKVDITHPDTSHLGIELISPSGTRSLLKSVKDGSKFANMRNMVFLSNAFYGENSRGNWQLRVVDGKGGKPNGFLNNWYIRIIGHRKSGESI